MKKYKEPIKRSIRTLTGKSKTGVIGICCSQCDLVFEKQELLQVHMYTHMSNVLCGDPLTAGGLPVTQRTGESSTGN